MDKLVASAKKCELSELGYALYVEDKYGISACNQGSIQNLNNSKRSKLIIDYLEGVNYIDSSQYKIKEIDKY